MSLATNSTAPDVSVLVPAKDEADNLAEFVRLTREAMLPLPFAVELVIINDGSHDGTAKLLDELTAKHPFVRVVTHRTQRGIADALKSGADVARGRVLVYYPADLQYLPSDIPSLVGPILEGQADVVTGTKQGGYNKRFVSGIYNTLSRWLFGVRVKDLNSVKAYRRDLMEIVTMRPDWHRFMVVIAASQGFRLAERPVPVHPRRAGSSKFGVGRIPVGALDLLSVWFQLRFGRKPMLFFGIIGAMLFLLGLLVGGVALYLRYGPPHIGFRPLLDLIMVLVISGVVLFGFGFVGEMLAGMREEMRAIEREVRRLRDK
ncbi:MAG: hypothetical protein DMD64_07760 [Gemmatimonadetes bacterium]|nr:MAG: hypothetical protein DMD64_07760 [Gemmatimonadota bacterium]